MALCQEDGSLSVIDYDKNVLACKFKEHISGAKDVIHSPLSKILLITVGTDRQIVFYDT
jgi:hypothetical protein